MTGKRAAIRIRSSAYVVTGQSYGDTTTAGVGKSFAASGGADHRHKPRNDWGDCFRPSAGLSTENRRGRRMSNEFAAGAMQRMRRLGVCAVSIVPRSSIEWPAAETRTGSAATIYCVRPDRSISRAELMASAAEAPDPSLRVDRAAGFRFAQGHLYRPEDRAAHRHAGAGSPFRWDGQRFEVAVFGIAPTFRLVFVRRSSLRNAFFPRRDKFSS